MSDECGVFSLAAYKGGSLIAARPSTIEHPLDDLSQPVVVVAGGNMVGHGLELIHGVAHGDAQPGANDHRHIVDVVADGANFLGRIPHSSASRQMPAHLVTPCGAISHI